LSPETFRRLEAISDQFKGKTIAMLGAGGAAKAIADQCGRKEVKSISIYDIDRTRCLNLTEKLNQEFPKCKAECAPSIEELDVGAIVVATGFDLYGKERFPELGEGIIPDVIDGLQFERLNSASGPTMGSIFRPSDGKVPKEMVFIQCVASRKGEIRAYELEAFAMSDTSRLLRKILKARKEEGWPYCSRICCMNAIKNAILIKEKLL
jgi:heterodisulfide reductase subunit A